MNTRDYNPGFAWRNLYELRPQQRGDEVVVSSRGEEEKEKIYKTIIVVVASCVEERDE